MKRICVFFFLFIVLFFKSAAYSEQFVLSCKLKISAVNVLTNEILRTYFIDRYFIVDTLLERVFDANNLPLEMHEFNESTIIFSKRAFSFADVVDTRITYHRNTHQMSLNEIYAYSSKFDQRAKFVTKGEGSCTETKINRKPLF